MLRQLKMPEKVVGCSAAGSRERVLPRKKESGQFLVEERGVYGKSADVSSTKSDLNEGRANSKPFDSGYKLSPTRGMNFNEVISFEDQTWHFGNYNPIKFNSSIGEYPHKNSKDAETQSMSVLATQMPKDSCKYSDISVQTTRLSLGQSYSSETVAKMEIEMSRLRQALKEAQERLSAEEMHAKKVEEDARHWMGVAKERLTKLPPAVAHVSEDPSEGSSSSALSGILTDFARQHSEMSDYVSDQTGGEDSEPSLPQSPFQKRGSRARPGSIPLEVPGSGASYLSPQANITLTSRQDAFSSPDLGIESDPGRFSSLENPPKTPEETVNGMLKFADFNSSRKAVSRDGTSVNGSAKWRRSLWSRTSADDLLGSGGCLNDLRLENEQLKKCLAETQKNLDETMSKLDAANRRKLHIEKAICNQLQKTHHILRKARVNLGAELRE